MSEEKKKVAFRWKYGTEEVSITVSAYASRSRLYVGLVTYEDGFQELFCDITKNLPEYSLGKNEAFIAHDLNDELMDFIAENKLGKDLGYSMPSGFCRYRAVAFDLERLREFDPEGVAEYERIIS